jgi:hypothetical protein
LLNGDCSNPKFPPGKRDIRLIFQYFSKNFGANAWLHLDRLDQRQRLALLGVGGRIDGKGVLTDAGVLIEDSFDMRARRTAGVSFFTYLSYGCGT